MPDAIFFRCLEESYNVIIALHTAGKVPGHRAEDIQIRDEPDDGERLYDGISICPTEEELRPGLQARDDVGYGVLVVQVLPTSKSHAAKKELLRRMLKVRESIRRRFDFQASLPITEVYEVLFEPRHLHVEAALRKNKIMDSFVLRCWSRENRDPTVMDP